VGISNQNLFEHLGNIPSITKIQWTLNSRDLSFVTTPRIMARRMKKKQAMKKKQTKPVSMKVKKGGMKKKQPIKKKPTKPVSMKVKKGSETKKGGKTSKSILNKKTKTGAKTKDQAGNAVYIEDIDLGSQTIDVGFQAKGAQAFGPHMVSEEFNPHWYSSFKFFN